MVFAQWWNHIMTRFSECIPVIKWSMTVYLPWNQWPPIFYFKQLYLIRNLFQYIELLSNQLSVFYLAFIQREVLTGIFLYLFSSEKLPQSLWRIYPFVPSDPLSHLLHIVLCPRSLLYRLPQHAPVTSNFSQWGKKREGKLRSRATIN